MAMMRPRRPTFRSQPSFRPVYLDFTPKSDMTENPEAHVLFIQLPGFTRERIRVQYEDSSKLMRVSGEIPIEGNRRRRFRGAYPVPQNCNINQIQSNFRQGILTIMMPKKMTSQPEVKPTQEEALAGSPPPPPPPQKAEQAIPPQPAETQQETRGDEKTDSSASSTSGTGPGDMKAIPSQGPVVDSQKPEKELTMAVAEKKADGVPQKVKEEIEPKPTLDEKVQKLDQAKVEDEKPQKGQEEIDPKPTKEMVPSKPLDEKPEGVQEGTDQNATLKSIPEMPVERRDEDAEKERISSKGIIEQGKPSESRKTGNGVEEKSMVTEKEVKETRELVKAGEHSVPKIQEMGKKPTTKAEAAAALAKEWNLNDGMIGTIGNGIKEAATSASQAITRIAEGKWDNEDKPLLLNIGASILVLAAVGGYVLYRFIPS